MNLLGGFFISATFSVLPYSIKYSGTNKVWIYFSSILETKCDGSVEVPTKPLEDGRFGSDSKIRKPSTLEIKARVDAVYDLNKAIKKFEDAVKNPTLFTINTFLRSYENYTLSNFSFKNDSTTPFTVIVELTFNEIMIQESVIASLSNPLKLSNSNLSDTVELGRKEVVGGEKKVSQLKKLGKSDQKKSIKDNFDVVSTYIQKSFKGIFKGN